jgi:hypothetical protein
VAPTCGARGCSAATTITVSAGSTSGVATWQQHGRKRRAAATRSPTTPAKNVASVAMRCSAGCRWAVASASAASTVLPVMLAANTPLCT